ncbi:helix-turn-helix domain-containing protein [Gordonia jacobaea]|uniref:helix-turn-helix domain-containing protein n=1 Tax=Gordonia jacobaea TaxID=122202 RepID=UPI003D746D59
MTSSPEPTLDLGWLKRSTLAAITMKQTAEVLGVDQRTVSRAVRDGQIPSIRVGRRAVVPRMSLLAMLGATPSGDTSASEL